jgi:hypothetical protein
MFKGDRLPRERGRSSSRCGREVSSPGETVSPANGVEVLPQNYGLEHCLPCLHGFIFFVGLLRIPDQGDRCFRAIVTEDSGGT